MVLGQRGAPKQAKPPRVPASTPGEQPPPYNWRATIWLIVGILVVVGAMGVFMRVIPTPFTQPAATAIPTAGPVQQPAAVTPVPTLAPTPLVLNMPTVGPTTPQSQPATVAPAIQPTRAPTSASTAQSTSVPVVAPTAKPTQTEATPAPTVDPALEADILAAYQRYWSVLDDAIATLDDSKLSGAMDGPALVAAQTYVNQLRSENKAGVGPEDHSITLVSATPDDAVIHDHVVDHSIFVDPTTREPLPPDQQGTNTETDSTYYLRNVDGVWKVVGAR